MTVSNVRRMSKSSKVDGGGTTVAVATLAGLADASPEVVPVDEGGGAVLEGSTRGRLELYLI